MNGIRRKCTGCENYFNRDDLVVYTDGERILCQECHEIAMKTIRDKVKNEGVTRNCLSFVRI